MKRTNRGFTLTELLIVVVIIAIMAGATFVLFDDARLRAWEAEIRSSTENAGRRFSRVYTEDIHNAIAMEVKEDAFAGLPRLEIERSDGTRASYGLAARGGFLRTQDGDESFHLPNVDEWSAVVADDGRTSASVTLNFRFYNGAYLRNYSKTFLAASRIDPSEEIGQ